MFSTAQNPGVGPSFLNVEFNVYNRTGGAVVVGNVLMLDHLAADGGGYAAAGYNSTNPNLAYGVSTLNVDGGLGGSNAATWPWGNALTPTAAGISGLSGAITAGTGAGGAPLVVVTSLLGGAGANDTKIKVCIRGLVAVSAITTEPVVFGDTLFAAAAVTLTPTATAGVRHVAKALSAKADDATDLVLCAFDGMSGLFGAAEAS